MSQKAFIETGYIEQYLDLTIKRLEKVKRLVDMRQSVGQVVDDDDDERPQDMAYHYTLWGTYLASQLAKLNYFERLVTSTHARFCKPTAGFHPQFTGPYCGVMQINNLLEFSADSFREANRRVQKNIDLALEHQGMETRTFRYVCLID